MFGHVAVSHVTVDVALLVGQLGAVVHAPVNHVHISVIRLLRIVVARVHGAIHVRVLMVEVDDYVSEGPQVRSLAPISADHRHIVRVWSQHY